MSEITRPSDARFAIQLVDRYLALHAARDLEGVLSVFSENATLEDPVGAPIRQGLEAIRNFYRGAHERNGRLAIERIGAVLACGDEVAAHVQVRPENPGDAGKVDVIYTLRLDKAGRIASLRAYF